MKYIFKISSIIFRAGLLLVPMFALIASILVGAAGHSSNFKKTDSLLFIFCITSFIVITVYENAKQKTKSNLTFLLAFTVTLVSAAFLVYFMVDSLFINEFKDESNPIFNGLLGFFLVTNLLVLGGFLFDKKALKLS